MSGVEGEDGEGAEVQIKGEVQVKVSDQNATLGGCSDRRSGKWISYTTTMRFIPIAPA